MFLFIVLLCLLPSYVNAHIEHYQIEKLEVFGVDSRIGEKILAHYAKPILAWLDRHYNNPAHTFTEEELQTYLKTQYFFEKSIGNQHHFAFVKIEPVIYPESREIITTINILDLVSKIPSFFYEHVLGRFPDKDKLIEKWLSYEQQGMRLAIAGELPAESQNCQYHHCLFGFSHKKLRIYEHWWSNLTKKQVKNLFIISKFDQREAYRAAAVFILAHINQCDSLYEFSTSALLDSSVLVRNNALRVYAMSLKSCHYTQVPWKALSINLNYPSVMLRNKTLSIFAELYLNRSYQQYISLNFKKKIKEICQSIQPNLNQFNFCNS